jgi:rhodanese-related sulfurtransferase
MSDRFWWLPFGKVPEIKAADLQARLDQREPLQLIDVRSAGEFAGGHIKGAINVPISQLRSTLPALKLDANRPVIAICATAHRSPPAVRVLRHAGFDAKQLQSGMIAWQRSKLPITKK